MRRCFSQMDSTSPLPRNTVALQCMGTIGQQPDQAPPAFQRAAENVLAAHDVLAGHGGIHHL